MQGAEPAARELVDERAPAGGDQVGGRILIAGKPGGG
jgi:hypothetical protein